MTKFSISGSSALHPSKKLKRKITKREISKSILVEVAWEVCNQMGGIYTVIRSKIPSMVEYWGEHYCLLGPYVHSNVSAEFEPISHSRSPIGRAVEKMREMGYEVHYGHWLVSGRPQTVLFNPFNVYDKLGEIKYELWEHHDISTPGGDEMLDQTIAFGHQVEVFLQLLTEEANSKKVVGHFHEWMAGIPIPQIRRKSIPVSTVFTTHATLLGRYLAMNDPLFYEYLPFYDWQKEATHFNIEPMVKIERAAAHGSHVFTTVSELTANECEHLLGRKPDEILPNGLNIERFEALHEFQNLHLEYKERIHQAVMGHFFQSYSFDLNNTLYFFTSGRFEYKNKGYDLTLEALARLNWWLKQDKSPVTIVMFIITKRPFHSINPMVLHSKAIMEEVRQCCDEIQHQVGEKLFYAAAASLDHRLPNLSEFVDDYMRLRLRRTLQSWKSDSLPPIVTHNLVNDAEDEVLNFLRNANLINYPDDRVKFIYHPDFISPTNPLFGMEYHQFVRGCHMGIFPSYYEPWGYTPLECIASGVPSVTSDLSGFGDYALKSMKDPEENGISVTKRRHGNFDKSANELATFLYNYVQLNRRERIAFRNQVESNSVLFDWQYLASHYDKAHKRAIVADL
ncbi:glycosyltransferase [Rapidithrix thailandica]|uniref:Glycosyltransferase n=1 Tax=Rapidithrix thailandica TaxID=413964 RepID=A0AAW9S2E2_9BACT